MLAPSAALAAPSLPRSPGPLRTMHPFDDASVLSATSAEGSFNLRQQLADGAASSSPPPPRGSLAGGERSRGGGIIRCQDCWLLAKADCCAHRRCRNCCRSRGFVCPAHVKPSSLPDVDVPASQCSERCQQTPAASASTAAVAPTRKRPRALLHSVATATSSSVGQPTAAPAPAPAGRFAPEVRLDAVVFRRVRLAGPDAEVAYHASVTIGGHVFRGVLFAVGGRRGTASTDTGESSEVSSQSTAGGGDGVDLTLRL